MWYVSSTPFLISCEWLLILLKNTVIIVITEIIDIRNKGNQNKRYMKHQLRADNGKNQDVTVQVTEVQIITISNNNGSDRNGNGKGTQTQCLGQGNINNNVAATAASDAVANAIQTVDPNAPFSANNQTLLLPSGAPAPVGNNVELDPAAIVEDLANGLLVQQV